MRGDTFVNFVDFLSDSLTYVVRSFPSKVSLSRLTPSGGSLTMVISSFCSLRCKKNNGLGCATIRFFLFRVPSHLPARIVRGGLDFAAAPALPLGEGHLAEHALQLARRHLWGFTSIEYLSVGKTKRRRIKEGSTAASRSALSQCPCLCLKPLALPPSAFPTSHLSLGREGGREGGCSLSLSLLLLFRAFFTEGRREGCRSFVRSDGMVGRRSPPSRGSLRAVGRARRGPAQLRPLKLLSLVSSARRVRGEEEGSRGDERRRGGTF